MTTIHRHNSRASSFLGSESEESEDEGNRTMEIGGLIYRRPLRTGDDDVAFWALKMAECRVSPQARYLTPA